MSKAVMLSIRPKWCEKIASGEKTIEVRKTKPKLETPFKCYIYCTKASVRYQTICGCHVLNSDELYRHPEQGIKHGYSIELMLCENYTKDNFLNGKVIGEFTCDRIYELAPLNHAPDDVERKACLTREEIVKYLKGIGYGWHITDLRIYDTPRELSEFWRDCPEYSELSTNCWGCENVCGDDDETDCNTDGRLYIRRAPQSWCYVEAMEGK